MRIRVRLLPTTIIVAAVFLTMRLGTIWTGFEDGFGGPSAARAAPGVSQSAARADSDRGMTNRPSKSPAKGEAATKSDNEEDLTEGDIKVLQALARRRRQLEQRERDIQMRAGLLKAAEKRVEEKIAELKEIQQLVGKLVKKYDEQEEAQMQSLVKIYVKMKPKQAARVFIKLDMQILLEVIARMKESKSALILAQMAPDKVREITRELATRRRLPKNDKVKAAR